jgi:hypothetical protein
MEDILWIYLGGLRKDMIEIHYEHTVFRARFKPNASRIRVQCFTAAITSSSCKATYMSYLKRLKVR